MLGVLPRWRNRARVVTVLVAAAILGAGCRPVDNQDSSTFRPPEFQTYENPSWSPDGREIAFNWNDSGKGFVGVVASTGGVAKKILGTDSYLAGAGAWYPGVGRILAHPPFGDPKRGWLVMADLDGTYVALTDSAEAAASWSFGGGQIALTVRGPAGLPNIFVMNADGTGARPVASVSGFFPFWSPDNERIVFCSVRSPRDNEGGQIYVVNVDGTGLSNLSNNSFHECNPAWSPDGQWIAFDQMEPLGGYNRRPRIGLMRPDGSERRRLFADDWSASNPAFSPDGTKIAYSHYVEPQTTFELRVVNFDGTGDYKVGGGERKWLPPDAGG